ncbi:MAG: hypothetical protein JO159_10650 [Acidobacteria bacterium]|nr:hypothetical protein [Acidobacteriota bacterium]
MIPRRRENGTTLDKLRPQRSSPGTQKRVIGVARFSNPALRHELEKAGVETIACDLLERRSLADLPDVENVIFVAGKVGTQSCEHLSGAMNTYVPGLAADRFENRALSCSQPATFMACNR